MLYIYQYIRVDANDAMHIHVYLNCARPPSSLLKYYIIQEFVKEQRVFKRGGQ